MRGRSIRYDLGRQLLEFNPSLNGKAVYICGTSGKALDIFYILIWYGYYVKGFVDDEFCYSTFFNKEVIAYKDFLKKSNAVLVEELCASTMVSEKEMDRYAFIINRNIIRDAVVLYGCGDFGKKMKHFLSERGIDILFFVDSFVETDKKYEGVNVYSKDYLSQLRQDVSIIITSDIYCEEIYKTIVGDIPDKKLFFIGEWLNMILNNKKIVFGFEYGKLTNERFRIDYDTFMIRFDDLRSRSLFIYGTSELELVIYKFLSLFDFNIIGFVQSNDYLVSEKNKISLPKPVFELEEILYYQDSTVVFWEYKKENVIKLKQLGRASVTNYVTFNRFVNEEWYERNNVLDVLIGHSYIGKCELPGFSVVSKPDYSKKRVVLLGGSTTDELLYSFKTWGDFLYDLNPELEILNGGVCAYTSSDILIKVMRDVLLLKPDVVIVYDGVNESWVKENCEFGSAYSTDVYKYVEKCYVRDGIWENVFGGGERTDERRVFNGLGKPTNAYERWYRHMRIINAVLKEYGIKGYFFLQPWLGTKKNLSSIEYMYTLTKRYADQNKTMQKLYHGFYQNKFEQNNDNFFCLSNIFDDEQDDIYMDIYHVIEKGNKIIADAVYNRVPELQRI